MEFQVLGALRVLGADGEQVKVASTAQRRLLSLLILRAGSVVSADALAEQLELSPGALRTSVSRLRRLLGPELLVTTPPGYELRTDAIDVTRFEQLVAVGRSTEHTAEARAVLEAALRLWRGEAYAEFADEPWAMTESWRLTEARAGTVERLVELLLDLGEWTESIVHLEPLITAHPLRDRPRSLLMRALADSGRRAEALRAFQSYRSLLIEQTGVEPSGDILALEHAIATTDAPGGALPAGPVSCLLSDVMEPDRLIEARADEVGPAIGRYYELVDEAIAARGGVRPVEQGEGQSVIGTFTTPGDALAAAVQVQRELLHELPWLPVRVAVHTSEAELRGSGRYLGGAIRDGERLRAFGHGGQILVSANTVAAIGDDLPRGASLKEVGTAPFRHHHPPERVAQVVHPEMPSEFPPLRVTTAPARQGASAARAGTSGCR